MKGEIIIEFSKEYGHLLGIKLISSSDIKAHYESIGKNVPFTFVGIPYVQIGEDSFAVIPLAANEPILDYGG